MRIPVAAALVLLVALGACGGGDEPASSNAPTKDTSTRDNALKELTEKTKARADQLSAEHGKPAPQDLTSFRCARDAKGQWNAVDSPVWPCSSRYLKRALVSSGRPNPANIRMVHSRPRYIVG
jgi:hypothetical protein